MVLQRSARDVILPRLHRKFSSPKILIDNAAALYQQLSMLHPDFFYCVDYDSMTNMTPEDRQHLLDFIHPVQLAGKGGKLLPPRLPSQQAPPSPLNFTELGMVTTDFYVMQLDQIMLRIQSLCNNKNQQLIQH